MNKLPTISSASFNIKVLPKRVHMLLEVLTADKWFSAEDLLDNASIRDQLKVARYIRENLLIMSESGLVSPHSAVCACIFSQITWRADEQGRA